MISMYVYQDHPNWDVVLPFISFVNNTAVQSTTEFSKFSLVYGREAVCTLDTILPHPCNAMADAFVEEATRRREVGRQLAGSRIIEQ